jgi:GT2 family glycosyltransferase
MDYMFPNGGLANELAAIPDSEVVLHLRNYLGNFILDTTICTIYINRFAAIPQEDDTESIRHWIRYLVGKFAKHNPMDEQAANLWGRVNGTPLPHERHLTKCRAPAAVQAWLDDQLWQLPPDQARPRLLQHFKAFPYAPSIIWRLIENDVQQNIPAGSEWSERVALPPLLRPLMHRMLAEALHLQNLDTQAMELLASLNDFQDNEYWHNTAAEIYARNGERQQAAHLYAKSYHLDQNQAPVRDRLNELLNPFKPDPSSLSARTAICLYSWNKCDLLENTLRSLASSETGAAAISVLLNGCTDNSVEMVESLNRDLFGGRINMIALPVNIGAPAARNWLLATKEARTADYVAFLDDDVDVPSNWLPSLLTVLRNNPDAGVAGAKIINPGQPCRLQYLYRNVSVAKDGMIRLSLDSPHRNYDSGIYDFVRETDNVMGCCHVLTRKAIDAVPHFDIRFSPSQMDDIAHDLEVRINGFKIIYCGLVACCHHQMSGVGRATPSDMARRGNVIGNDAKFYYKFYNNLEKLKTMNNHQPTNVPR